MEQASTTVLAPPLLLLLLSAVSSSAQQPQCADLYSCCTPAGAACQVGPPTSGFAVIFVPEVHTSVASSLPALVASHRGTVAHVLMEFYAPWCPVIPQRIHQRARFA
jgi:hypothetical protein